MEYRVRTVYSGRRTMCIEISGTGEVILRLPYGTPPEKSGSFLAAKRGWIEKHLAGRVPAAEPTEAEVASLRKKAEEVLPGRVSYYAERMGLFPTGMRITSARHRFGSCSGKNAVCFSLFLMRYPPEAVDYVVVHELAHIRYKNHGKAFHALIRRYLPDEKERRKLLRI